MEAANVESAIGVAQEYPVHLLISDIVLGGDMNGIQLAGAITDLRPNAKVLLMSGHFIEQFRLQAGWQFISKPFALADLLHTVHGLVGNTARAQTA